MGRRHRVCGSIREKRKSESKKLLETILLVADLRELKANPDAPATGTVLESRVDKGRGPGGYDSHTKMAR